MKYIKRNERYFQKVKIEKLDTDYYKNKFFISETDMNYLYVVLVDNMIPWNLKYRPTGPYFKISSRTLNVVKNQVYCGVWGESYTIKELDDINFMTSSELYSKYPKICYNLYYKLMKDSVDNLDNYSDWHTLARLKYISGLESITDTNFQNDIKDIKIKIDAEKYNI